MIPKIIHYCWLSGEEKPPEIKRCISSWNKLMPDYEIVCWDMSKFDINSVPFVQEACKVKKWAFAADYIRLYALHTEGGIYLDSDVLVKKTFDPYLEHDFFTAVEHHPCDVKKYNTEKHLNEDGTSINPFTHIPGIGIQAAIIAGEKGHPFFIDCMRYYHDRFFINKDGTYNDDVIAPAVFAMTAEKYGFKYIDKQQNLENNMLILPSNIFASSEHLSTDESFAIHMGAGSWRTQESTDLISKFKNLIKIMIRKFKSN